MRAPLKTGVLLINLGTPDTPDAAGLRRYLREFLSDPRVLDISPLARWLLVNLIIVPFRAPKSAAAYRSVWTEAGSPLLLHGLALKEKVAKELGAGFVVELAMRYGRPSIIDALERLAASDAERLVVFPLFPQYSSATTGSVLDRVFTLTGRKPNIPAITTVAPFYDDERYIAALVHVAKPALDAFEADHVLFSYHGLPERQIKRGDPSGEHCLIVQGCCDSVSASNRYCYRAHCFSTTRSLAERLGLAQGSFSTTFQSRFGRAKWIEPYTDQALEGLLAKGVKRLAVLSGAFVADCLETLEELGMQLREQWLQLGGEDLLLVPALNSDARWATVVADLAREQAES